MVRSLLSDFVHIQGRGLSCPDRRVAAGTYAFEGRDTIVKATAERASRDRWPDDASLVSACRDGDTSAWEALIQRYRRLVYSVPVAYRLAPDQADDVFQRVALKLFENLSRIRNVEGLASWLVVTTRRECRALRRGEGRFRSIEDEEVGDIEDDSKGVGAALEEVEREHAVALALESMGEPCRGLLHALYVEDPTPSYEEIGRRLGRPVGSLGPTRSRCLAKLQKLYEKAQGRPRRSEPCITGEGDASR